MKLHPKIVYIIFFLYGNAHCSHNTFIPKKILAEIIDFKQSLTKKDCFYLILIAFLLHKIFKIEKNQNKKIENLETQQKEQNKQLQEKIKNLEIQLLNLINILEKKDQEQKKINKQTNANLHIFKKIFHFILSQSKKFLRINRYEKDLQKQKKINNEQKQINTNEILARTELEKSILIIVEMLTQCKNQYNTIQKLIEIVNQSLNQKYKKIEFMYQKTEEINKENKKITEKNQTISENQKKLEIEINIQQKKLDNFINNFYIMSIQFKKQQEKAHGYYLEAQGLFDRIFVEANMARQSLQESQEKSENFLQFIQKKEKEINDQHQYLNQFCQTLRCTINKIQKDNKSNYDASSLMSSSYQKLSPSPFQILSHSQIITTSPNQKI